MKDSDKMEPPERYAYHLHQGYIEIHDALAEGRLAVAAAGYLRDDAGNEITLALSAIKLLTEYCRHMMDLSEVRNLSPAEVRNEVDRLAQWVKEHRK